MEEIKIISEEEYQKNYNKNVSTIEQNNEKEQNFNKRFLDIRTVTLNQIIDNRAFALKVDFQNTTKEEMKKLIKKALKLKKKAIKNILPIGIENTTIIILNYDENNKEHEQYAKALQAILKNNDLEMYNYIYDEVCKYLDHQFCEKNLCDFKDDKCGEKKNTDSTIGCCRHYKNIILGAYMPKSEFVQCEYLKDNHCSIQCLPCKLFTCDYVEKKGIKFKIKDIFLLDTFFNPLQKYRLKTMVYTPKEKIIKKLIDEK